MVNKIEIAQMGNNILLSGIPEQPWEPYESTKERVIEVIEAVMAEARKINITCCSRVGTHRLGKLS